MVLIRVGYPTMTSINIHDALDETLNAISSELNCKAEVRKKYGKVPEITCNPSGLVGLLANILIEAAKTIEERGEISISTWSDEGSVYASIRSNGTGVSRLQFPQMVQTVLEALHATEKQCDWKGSRAMTVCELVGQHSACLSIEGDIGKGTAFTLQLPVDSRGEAVSGKYPIEPETDVFGS